MDQEGLFDEKILLKMLMRQSLSVKNFLFIFNQKSKGFFLVHLKRQSHKIFELRFFHHTDPSGPIIGTYSTGWLFFCVFSWSYLKKCNLGGVWNTAELQLCSVPGMYCTTEMHRKNWNLCGVDTWQCIINQGVAITQWVSYTIEGCQSS